MGCAASATQTPVESSPAAARPKARPRKNKPSSDEVIRMVLLGQGESGKSTIFKQMRIIQAREEGRAETFSDLERQGQRLIIYNNVFSQMKVLVDCAFAEDMEFSDPSNAELVKKFREMRIEDIDTGSAEAGAMIKKLWSDEALKVIYGERDRLFNLNDGAGYFWDSLDRLYKPDYLPTEADMLRTRLRTIGFDEATFTYKKKKFCVADLGGQRSERRGWLDEIQKASTILFVSSLCEFDQNLREDFSQSRMRETLHLFNELLEHSATESKCTIVLLNKLDLFRAKFQGSTKGNFQRFFKDYHGPLEVEQCLEHIKKQFLDIAQRTRRRIIIHTIIAVETDNIKLVWQDIRNLLLQQIVEQSMDLGSL